VVRASERSPLIDKTNGAQRDSFMPTVAGSKVEFLRYTMPPRIASGPFAAVAGPLA
jgi:hypothetical protein